MIVVYKKETNEFIGMAPQIFDNGVVRDYTLEELYPNLAPEEYGCFFVEDSPRYVMNPTHWKFKLDKNGVPIGIEHKPTLALKITTDAEDTDGDGMPELKADGSSKAKLTVKVYDGAKVKKTTAQIKLSTSGGRLDQRIFDLKNKSQLTTYLTSTTETITITVTASAEGMHSDSLTFELMP